MTAELAVLPLLVCPCGWVYRVRCTNALHWPDPPRMSPRGLTLEVVRPRPDGDGVA